MKALFQTAVALVPLAWAGFASAQSQTVMSNGSPVTTGKDVAPAGASYHVPAQHIAEAVIAVAVQGSQQVGIVHGPYNALATGMSTFGVANTTIKNTGSVCGLCRPQGGVGAAQFGSNFFVAFPDTSEHIHLLMWKPQDWPNATPTSDTDFVFSVDGGAKTTYAPNLVAANGSLFLAFRDDNSHLHVWSSAAGDFSDVVKLIDTGDGQASDWAPAIARLGANVILGRQHGAPGCVLGCPSPDLMVSVGSSFNPEADFGDARMDNSGPGALGFGSNLFLSWRGSGNRSISFTQMTIGQLTGDLGSGTNTPNGVSVLGNGEQSEHTPNLVSIGDADTGFSADLIWHDGSTSSTGSDGTNLLFETVATLPPTPVKLCSAWNANYIDSMLGEDVLGMTSAQSVPAAFANFALVQGSTAVFHGTFDKTGCADVTDVVLSPDGTIATPNTWTLQLDGTFTKNLHSGAGKAQFQVTPAQALPLVGVTPPTETVSTTFSVTGPGTIQANPTTLDEVTGVSAFVSVVLAREETDDLGLTATSYILFAKLGCQGSDCDINNSNCPMGSQCDFSIGHCFTSCTTDADCSLLGEHCDPSSNRCASDNSCADAQLHQLYIAPPITAANNCPANINAGDSRWKFIIAHEFGHVVQNAAGAALTGLYNPQVPNRPPVCRCDHVTVANQEHCMQGLQRWSDSQEEGFAHFYSANVWNSKVLSNGSQNASCTFEYYKEFLVTNQPNLPSGDFINIQTPGENPAPALESPCDTLDSGIVLGNGGPGTFFSIKPPMFVDCLGNPTPPDPRSFVNYRLQAACWPASPDTTDLTTEFDWLKFYTNINRNPMNTSVTIPITQILSLYNTLCGGKPPPNNCNEGTQLAPTAGTPNWDTLLMQAQTTLSSARAALFAAAGKTFGVNRN